MTSWHDDPAEVERAKALAAGDAGRAIVRISLEYCQPILFGDPANHKPVQSIRTASATLVTIGSLKIAVTCAHVFRAYSRLREATEDRKVIFQVGNVSFDPLERLLDVDDALDIASFDLADLNHTKAGVRGGPLTFHEPTVWPPNPVVPGDFVSLSGFPGAWKDVYPGGKVEHDTFSVGPQEVTSVSEGRIACVFERGNWVQSSGTRGVDLKELGGMSGGPVFILRRLHWELAGIITDFSESFDLLYAAPARRLAYNGRIEP